MSDPVKEVKVQFTAQTDQFRQGARKVGDAVERVAQVMGRLKDGLARVGSVGVNFLRGFGEGAVQAFRQTRQESVRGGFRP